MINLKSVGLLILMMILSACSTMYLPVASGQTIISEGFGVVKTEDLMLAVTHDFWVKEPQELTDYFMTFYVTIKNRSDEKIGIFPEDMNLLDEQGNQYDVVVIEEIMNLLVPEEIVFDQFGQFEQENDEIYESWKEAKNNLMMDSFNFGAILPRAQKSGYVFFPRQKSSNKTCRFIYQEFEIQFVREK